MGSIHLGQAYWNRDALLATGWGAKAWNDGEWGNLADETVSLTGIASTSSLGTVNLIGKQLLNQQEFHLQHQRVLFHLSYRKQ